MLYSCYVLYVVVVIDIFLRESLCATLSFYGNFMYLK